MAVNVSKLEQLIEERSSKPKVAEQIGINKSTFYRKLKGEGKGFTVDEAQKLAKVIPLSNEEAVSIFFGTKVAKNATFKEKGGGEVGGY